MEKQKGNILTGGTISAIYKNGTITMPDKKTKIETGDVLIIVAQDAHINSILKSVKTKN